MGGRSIRAAIVGSWVPDGCQVIIKAKAEARVSAPPFEVPFSFRCSYCGQAASVTSADLAWSTNRFWDPRRKAAFYRELLQISCPDPGCRELTLVLVTSSAHTGTLEWRDGKPDVRMLIPETRAQQFPDDVPGPIREDYREAFDVLEKSAKASATLSRRAVQGMIRDRFGAQARTLAAELDQAQGQIDPSTWNAIEAVRHIGNVGAHMERNADEIIPVTLDEARALLGLVEFLIEDWYVLPAQRAAMLAKVTGMGDAKALAAGKPRRRHPATPKDAPPEIEPASLGAIAAILAAPSGSTG